MSIKKQRGICSAAVRQASRDTLPTLLKTLEEKRDDIVAVFCADLHICEKAPVFRSPEKDNWIKTQRRTLLEIAQVCNKCNAGLFIAGDIFDRWNSPPIIINMVIDVIGSIEHSCYGIPGQHDLPNHRIEDINQSALKTLDFANCLYLYETGSTAYEFSTFDLTIANWNSDLPKNYEITTPSHSDILMTHNFFYINEDTGFPNAPDKALVKHELAKLGWDIIISGDNHIPFQTMLQWEDKQTLLFNCGSVMRRTKKQIDHEPRIGLLTKHGEMISYLLDIQQDRIADVKDEDKACSDKEFSELFSSLQSLGASAIDFANVLNEITSKYSKDVQNIITKGLEQCQN